MLTELCVSELCDNDFNNFWNTEYFLAGIAAIACKHSNIGFYILSCIFKFVHIELLPMYQNAQTPNIFARYLISSLIFQ